jgi:HEAT repeat protein
VAIRSSASQEVRRLVADLTSVGPDQATRRDAAIARLTVIGTRAVRQLLDALSARPAPAQHTSLLLALEAIPDPRAVEPVLSGLGDGDIDVRIAAARAGRGLLALPQGTIVLDRLTAIVLNRSESGELRAAALEALIQLPARTVKPVLDQVKDDPSPAVRAVLRRGGAMVEDPVAELEEASDGWLPRDPHAVLEMVSRAGADAPLSTLHRLVERVRSKESEGRKSRRREWLAIRGALHVALARRGSKVALYDLREAIEQATEPLPSDFLEALSLIGDTTALEPLAAAYVQSESMDDSEGWRRGLAEAFRAVVAREKVTGRHSAIKRVRSRFRDHVAELLSP